MGIMLRRAFVQPQIIDDLLAGSNLDPETTHRFSRILRLPTGTRVELFDGTGRVLQGTFNAPNHLRDIDLDHHVPSKPTLVIAQALSKMDKLEQVAQRGTELGAHEFWFFKAEHSVVDLKDKASQKIDRLTRIAQDASRQSERIDVPSIKLFSSTQTLLQELTTLNTINIIGTLEATCTLSQILKDQIEPTTEQITLVIGPEGGLSPSEIQSFVSTGAFQAKWGPHVLRTETAALSAIAVIQSFLGRA